MPVRVFVLENVFCQRSEGSRAINALSLLVHSELERRGWGLRDLARATGISASSLSGLVNPPVDKPPKEPRLSTLALLSIALDIPMRRLVEACGYPVEPIDGVSGSEARIAAVLRSVPALAPVLTQLSELPPDDQAAVLSMIESLQRRRR